MKDCTSFTAIILLQKNLDSHFLMGFFWRQIVKSTLGIRTRTKHKQKSEWKRSYSIRKGIGDTPDSFTLEIHHERSGQPRRTVKIKGIQARRKAERLLRRLDSLIKAPPRPPPCPRSPVTTLFEPSDYQSTLIEAQTNRNEDIRTKHFLPSYTEVLCGPAESDAEFGDLIPGLSNEVAMLCLGRLNFKDRSRLKSVNKSWFLHLSSEQFDRVRFTFVSNSKLPHSQPRSLSQFFSALNPISSFFLFLFLFFFPSSAPHSLLDPTPSFPATWQSANSHRCTTQIVFCSLYSCTNQRAPPGTFYPP